MQYRPYGKTGHNASRLGYGAMHLPMDDNGDVIYDKAVEVLRHSLAAGVNTYDTHHNYHRSQSEESLGRAFADVRDKVYIQTKNPFYRPDTPEDTYRQRLEDGLKRLRSDYVDGYMAHSVNEDSWNANGQAFLEAAHKFRDEGLIRHIGFSGHGTAEFTTRLIESGEIDMILLQYNILDRTYESCFARAHELGVGVGIMGPLAGGRLGPPVPEVASMIPQGVASTVELCLRFVWSNPNIDVAFSGMTIPAWVDENADILDNFTPLGPADNEHLEAALAEKKKLGELYCTNCGYCMPCPHGVDIPGNFALMNLHRLYGATEWAAKRYMWKASEGEKNLRASACTSCGECEPKCPQNIEIINQLAETAQALGNGE